MSLAPRILGRLAPVLALLFAAAPARADQLIQIPTADIAPFTAEYKHRLNDGDREGYGTILFPAGSVYELMFRYYNNEDGRHRIEGGGQLQLLPDGVITPGIAVGMWDVTNSSRWGRRAFFVVTKSLRPGELGIPRPLESVQLTLGAGTGRLGGPLAGVRVNLPGRVSLVGEYDSRRINAGLWWSPVRPLTLKGELQNGNPYVGGDLRFRF